jgi:hypothetical protein
MRLALTGFGTDEDRRLARRTGSDDGLRRLPTNIEELHFYSCSLTDEGLRRLPLKNLRALYLCQTKVTDAGLDALRECRELRWLGIRGILPDAQAVRHLRGCSQLEFLDFGTFSGKSRIDDAAAAELTELKRLKELYLDGAKITDKGLAILERGLPDLQTLSVRGAPLTTEAVDAVRKARPNLNVEYWPDEKPVAQAP